MIEQFLNSLGPVQMCAIYFAGMIISLILGLKTDNSSRNNTGRENKGLIVSRSGILTILSLLMAFTFNMSGERHRAYKKAMMDEVNSIRTAWSRSDLYPEPYCSELRKNFLDYLDARISFTDAGTDFDKITDSKRKSNFASKNIWEISSRLFRDSGKVSETLLMAPSLTDMNHAATERDASQISRTPVVIFLLLFIMTFILFYIGGYENNSLNKKEILFILSFALVLTFLLYVIFDLDRPESGTIRASVENEAFMELRENVVNQR